MRICIDSCVFIRGLHTSDVHIGRLLDRIGPDIRLAIPRLIAIEVTRNLINIDQVRRFYGVFDTSAFAEIVDAPVPRTLVEKYSDLGLPVKADAVIGAFAEWQQIECVISDNRHFLTRLKSSSFVVLSPEVFVTRL